MSRSRRTHRPHPDDLPVGVRDGAALLGPRTPGEHHVGVLGGLGLEKVDDHEDVEPVEGLANAVGVRLGEGGVLAEDDRRPDVVAEVVGGFDPREARFRRRFDTPLRCDRSAVLGVGHVTVPRQEARERADVTGPPGRCSVLAAG